MLEVPMFRMDKTRVQLMELLASLPENEFIWSVLDFYGVGKMPNNESTGAFEKKVFEQPLGVLMTWSELSEFAQALDYTIDCLVVAIKDVECLEVNKLLADDFQQCEIAIRAIDSSLWILGAADQLLLEKMERAARY